MDLSEPCVGNMGVNLRGADVGVTEKLLNNSKVGSVVQQMSGKTVAEHVRGDIAADAGELNALLDSKPESHAGERSAPGG